MAENKVLDIPAPATLDESTPPWRASTNAGARLVNLLPHRPGVLSMRGPVNIHEASPSAYAAGTTPFGVHVHNNVVLTGARAFAGFNDVFPWKVPYHLNPAAGPLHTGTTVAKTFNKSTRAWTALGAFADVGLSVGSRGARLGAYYYYIAYDSSDATVSVNGKTRKRTHLILWDGTELVGGFTKYANAPEGSQDIIAHKERIFMAGGRDVAGGAAAAAWSLNTIFYSDPAGPTADTTAMWQDDVSGLSNKIVVGEDDLNDFIVGFGKAGDALIVFKRNSVWALYGYSSSTFTVKEVTRTLGCLDPHSIAQVSDGVVFMSKAGLMHYDGSTIQSLSDGLDRSVQFSIGRYLSEVSDPQGVCRVLGHDNDYVFLGVGTLSATPTACIGTSGISALIHVPTKRVALYAGPPTGSGVVVGDFAFSAGKDSTGEIYGLTQSDWSGSSVNVLVELHNLTTSGRAFNGSIDSPLEDHTTKAADGTINKFISTYVEWRSKSFRLGGWTEKAQLQKWGFLYAQDATATPVTLTATLYDSSTETALGTIASTTSTRTAVDLQAMWPRMTEKSAELFNEADEVSIGVAGPASALITSGFRIRLDFAGAWVEYQTTRRRATP